MMEKDPKIVAISARDARGHRPDRGQEEVPGPVYDVGIAEEHAVIMAGGMAKAGWKPVVAIYSTFLQRSFDQIVHDVCLQNLPVTLCADRAGLVGDDGKTHHGIFDITYTRCVPNMTVAAPKDENELQHLLFTAIESGRPFAIRYPRGLGVGAELDRSCNTSRSGGARSSARVWMSAFWRTARWSPWPSWPRETLRELGVDLRRRQRPVRQAPGHGPPRADRRPCAAHPDAGGAPRAGGFGSGVLEAFHAAGLPTEGSASTRSRTMFVEHSPQLPAAHNLKLDVEGVVAKASSSTRTSAALLRRRRPPAARRRSSPETVTW
jgi:1-deoxy-D-xylulose-5-phosphate synthase